MSFIRTIAPEDAHGALRRVYAAAIRRAGKLFGILRIQGLNPAVLEASTGLYLALMHGPSPLSRVEREALAVTVSRANDCFY